MSKFVKARYVDGPLHEFYVSEEAAALRPEKYEVIDATPLDQPGVVEYKSPTRKSVAKKSAVEDTPESK